jgi:uncharacterized membrane-anchored protein YjiN (DUF445 family)
MQIVPDEATKQRQLDIMKRRATALLVGSTVVFIATRWVSVHHPWFWLLALQATAEAAMVGGLADWFAVTALFRHPLGLPIPHTAIVATRKDRVGRSLGAFVQRNFLTREVIESRLRAAHAAERLAQWLAVPENARSISRHAAVVIASASQMLKDEDVERLIDRTVANRVKAVRVAPLLGRLLALVTEGNRHQELLNDVIRVAARAIEDNRTMIRDRIEAESPWWIPTAVDETIYKKVLTGIERMLVDIETNAAHPLRARFDASLRRFMDNLDNSPETAARVELWKEELLATDAARRFSTSLWNEGKSALIRYSEHPDAAGAGNVFEQALTTFATKVASDPELLHRVDEALVDVAVFLVARYQDDVGDLIAQTVQSWDPEVTSRRVELAIGRDLQFIRINGTLVGGLAGLLIFLVSHAFP